MSLAFRTLIVLTIIRSRRPVAPKKLIRQMSPLERRNRDRRTTRTALHQPSMSAFAVLFRSGCDQSLITLTGFNHDAFSYILAKFEAVYDAFTPYSTDGNIKRLPPIAMRKGRPRTLTATHCLGLVMTWTRSRGSHTVLCMIFGITGSVCSLFLRFNRRVLLRVLRNDQSAAVRMPSDAEISDYKEAINSKYSLLTDVYATAERLKLTLEQTGDAVIQCMFYNGWTHDHYVSNIFVFAPSGVIIACALNAPGSMHDSTIAEWGNVYSKMEEAYNRCGGRVVVDSAFSQAKYPFLCKSSQDHVIITDDFSEIARHKQATSLRQASEWGMRGLKGSFQRLKDRFLYEERGERRAILATVVHLFNLRARLVGLNQILTTFMPQLSVEANGLFGVSRISKFLFTDV